MSTQVKEERIINTFLRSITILSHLTNNTINKIQSNIIKKEFLKGEIIIEEGKNIENVYIVYKGEFILHKRIEVVFQVDEHESKIESKTVGIVQIFKSQFYGVNEVIDGTQSQFQLSACSDDCVAFLINKSDFMNLVVSINADLQIVQKISTAWNNFLAELMKKAKEQIVNQKQYLMQNKLYIKEKIKNQKIFETKSLERFLPDINANTPKTKRISQQTDSTSVKNTVDGLLPQRIKNVRNMVNLSKKSDIYSSEFIRNSNESDREKLNQVHYDKRTVNFNLQNQSNIIYKQVEIFRYSKEDQELFEQPRGYKNDLFNKILKIKKQEQEENDSKSPKNISNQKHENYFKQIDKRIQVLKNKYTGSPQNKQTQVDSFKNLDYYTQQMGSSVATPISLPVSLNFTESITSPKYSLNDNILKKPSNFNNINTQSSQQLNKGSLRYSTPL